MQELAQQGILVVEDEPEMGWVFRALLSSRGTVDCAINGAEALSKVSQRAYQVILLDAKLPDIEGLELAPQLKAHNPKAYILMISGFFYGDDVMVEKSIAAGHIDAFVSKPFKNDDIVRLVHEHLA